ncbi:MAG: major capsid protein [Nanoarchaeota archaeon]|nr:major capsid protein [Nanoarchaeota archaeon]
MHWYDQINTEFIRGVAVKYEQELDFEPFSLFPVIKTKKSSGNIAKYDKGDWLRLGNVNDYKRTGAAESMGGDYDVTPQPYSVEDVSFHKDITARDNEESDSPFDAVADGTRFVINRLKLIVIANFVSQFIATGLWGSDLQGKASGAGGDFTQWSDYTNSTPIDDILKFQDAVRAVTGFKPNRMLMTPDVYRVLRSNPDIKDSLKVTDDKVVTAGALKKLFDMDSLVVLGAVKSTAKKGETLTSSNTGYFATKKVLLTYAPNKASKHEPSGGYHILKTAGKKADEVEIRRIPMPQNNNALRVEGIMNLTPKLIASDLGCILYDAIV